MGPEVTLGVSSGLVHLSKSVQCGLQGLDGRRGKEKT